MLPYLNTRNGQILDMRYISLKRNKNAIKSDLLAKKMQNNNFNDFWKEIKRMNNCKTSLPTNIDGAIGTEGITQLWQNTLIMNCSIVSKATTSQ